MTEGLPIIIVDDDELVCKLIYDIVMKFYTYGEVFSFSDSQEALSFCRQQKTGVAIFILDVFLGDISGFNFINSILEKYPMAYQDTIVITGYASNDVVSMCVASDINYLLEKPIKPYALQLAVRAIASKYLKFAKILMQNPKFAERISNF